MRLAAHLGRVDVDAMLRGMTSRQFSEWIAYCSLDAMPLDRVEWAVARLCALVATALDGKHMWSASDFVPDADAALEERERPLPTADETAAMLEAMTLAMGGKVVRRGDDRNASGQDRG